LHRICSSSPSALKYLEHLRRRSGESSVTETRQIKDRRIVQISREETRNMKEVKGFGKIHAGKAKHAEEHYWKIRRTSSAIKERICSLSKRRFTCVQERN
jgi:hypothetical protein